MNSNGIRDIEFVISTAMNKFLKEQIGEQAQTVSAQVVDNSIVVRFKGVLPPAERQMLKTAKGVELIKELKLKLIEKARPLMEIMIKNLTLADVMDIHSCFNPETDERIEVFTLDKNPGRLV